jgi:hypothetical protein
VNEARIWDGVLSKRGGCRRGSRSDAHANLPALDAALAAIRGNGVAAVYHTGDAIGKGSFPAEVLDRLLHEPRMLSVMGTHAAWFAFDLPCPRPAWMGARELAHQHWVHAQLDPALRPVVAACPWIREEDIGGAPVAFVTLCARRNRARSCGPSSRTGPDQYGSPVRATPRQAGLLRSPALPAPGYPGYCRAPPIR